MSRHTSPTLPQGLDDRPQQAEHLDRPPPTFAPLTTLQRLLLATLACGWIGVFVVARMLEPDPRGFETHAKLGLPPCVTLQTTGQPCPTCGLTTSFSQLARGGWSAAWRANPAGFLLAGLGLGMIAGCGRMAWTGRRFGTNSLARSSGIIVVGAWTTIVVVGLIRRLFFPNG